MVFVRSALAFASVLSVFGVASGLTRTWGTTKNLFVFGDSYSATGYNVSAGINSPTPGYTSSNGPNWVQYLAGTYNVTETRVFNLASGGATTDSKLVTPYQPTVQSFVDQVTLFGRYFSSHPTTAPWTADDALFVIWIGINDVGNTWGWSNVTQVGFHKTVMDRYFAQVNSLYENGARSFLFLNVPPIERAPLFYSQGASVIEAVKAATDDYNSQLKTRVLSMKLRYKGIAQVALYDAHEFFNLQLDNASGLGFVNATGYNIAYENGTPGSTYQIPGSKPVSSYYWLNSLHPTFTVHNGLAHAISTFIS